MDKQPEDYTIKNEKKQSNHEEKIIDTINPIIYLKKSINSQVPEFKIDEGNVNRDIKKQIDTIS